MKDSATRSLDSAARVREWSRRDRGALLVVT